MVRPGTTDVAPCEDLGELAITRGYRTSTSRKLRLHGEGFEIAEEMVSLGGVKWEV